MTFFRAGTKGGSMEVGSKGTHELRGDWLKLLSNRLSGLLGKFLRMCLGMQSGPKINPMEKLFESF